MDSFSGFGGNVWLGLSTALELRNLFYCLVGVTLGTFVGALPGVGALAAIALLLPVTFHLDPTPAIIMLSGVYYGSVYGGSIASILLNLPGTPSTAVTCLDGYPMARQGRGGVALLMTTIASFFGASAGILCVMFFSPAIVAIAAQFGAAEYFSMMLLGLVGASTISNGPPLNGIAMVVLGVLLGLVGLDLETMQPRLTLGMLELADGLSLVALAMGLFGITEVIASARTIKHGELDRRNITFRSMIPTREDLRRSCFSVLRGSGLGAALGALPMIGGAIASFLSYAVEKKVSRHPEQFGHGAIEGIMGPESANNAADQTAFIPTLALGIPGSVVMALILGALMMHGIVPGPALMTDHPDLFWGLIMSFWIGNLMLLVLNIPFIGVWIRLLTIPYHFLYPAILVFVCVGVYSVHNSAFDVLVALVLGGVGYLFRLLNFHPAPLLLGFVLGPMMEENLRRALLISRGDFGVFIERPISAAFLAITASLLFWAILQTARRSGRKSASTEELKAQP